MQVRSKNGKRTVKLEVNERRALKKAYDIALELAKLGDGELKQDATHVTGSLATLLLTLNPEEKLSELERDQEELTEQAPY